MLPHLRTYLRQHHLALLALFIALGGTSYAATLPRNSVGARQIRRGAVSPSKVSAATIALFRSQGSRGNQGLPGSRGEVGATGAQGILGVAGAAGTDGTNGANGTALGCAAVDSIGAVMTGGSFNLGAATVTRPSTGLYCIQGLPYTVKNPQVTLAVFEGETAARVGQDGGCPSASASDVEVYTYNSAGDSADKGFFVLFN